MAKILIERVDSKTKKAEVEHCLEARNGTKFHALAFANGEDLWLEVWLEDPPLKRKNSKRRASCAR